jgi:hypothetical protein
MVGRSLHGRYVLYYTILPTNMPVTLIMSLDGSRIMRYATNRNLKISI